MVTWLLGHQALMSGWIWEKVRGKIKNWTGLPFPSPGDLPNPWIQFPSPALAGRFLTTELPGKQIQAQEKLNDRIKCRLVVTVGKVLPRRGQSGALDVSACYMTVFTLWNSSSCVLRNYVLFYVYGLVTMCWMREKSLQSCLTLCNTINCSLPSSSVHGILQARTLEWVAMPSSRGSSWPGNQTSSPGTPALQVDSLPLSHQESPLVTMLYNKSSQT